MEDTGTDENISSMLGNWNMLSLSMDQYLPPKKIKNKKGGGGGLYALGRYRTWLEIWLGV